MAHTETEPVHGLGTLERVPEHLVFRHGLGNSDTFETIYTMVCSLSLTNKHARIDLGWLVRIFEVVVCLHPAVASELRDAILAAKAVCLHGAHCDAQNVFRTALGACGRLATKEFVERHVRSVYESIHPKPRDRNAVSWDCVRMHTDLVAWEAGLSYWTGHEEDENECIDAEGVDYKGRSELEQAVHLVMSKSGVSHSDLEDAMANHIKTNPRTDACLPTPPSVLSSYSPPKSPTYSPTSPAYSPTSPAYAL